MKNLIFFILLAFLINSCASTNKLTDEAFNHALIGQNEMTIYSRAGTPTRIIPAPDGGKIMLYEFYSTGMYLTPNKSKVTYNAKSDLLGNRQGLTFSSVNTETNDPKYTIYQKNVSSLKIFLDKNGKCTRFEQDLPREQLEIYHERFKHFLPKD